MIKRCPIQIIEEGVIKNRVKYRFVALLKNIDFENQRYENLIRFDPKLDDKWIVRLFKWDMKADIVPHDIIRNPTIEEWKKIEEALIANNLRFNLKTSELIEL